MLCDYHVHTAYSDDSEYAMEQVVRDAIGLGLEEICFTDHVDYGIKRDWTDPLGIDTRPGGPGEPKTMLLANVDYPAYVREITALQEKYRAKIAIKLGLEFGAQTHTLPQYRSLFHKYPFDFILLSVHQIEDRELWNQAYQAGRTQEAYNLGYYEEMLSLVENFRDYSVLAHLDLITRYDKQGLYPFEKLRPVVTEILKTAIREGKGLEVNTSCHRYGLKDLTPSREILTLYRELGGRILTLGSDSHKPGHLGAYLRETRRALRNLGFTEFCTYEKMQPHWHPL